MSDLPALPSVNKHDQSDIFNLSTLNQTTTTKYSTITGNKRRDYGEKNVFKQLILIVVAFMIGYLPAGIYYEWTLLTKGNNSNFDFWFGIVSYLCIRLSECISPLIYILGSDQIRIKTKKLFRLN